MMTNATPAILQVLPRLQSGGVERGTVEIAEAIRAEGMKPLVVSAGGPMIPHVVHAGAEHITLPVDRKNPLIIHRNAWQLTRLIKAKGVSLIHARSRAPAWAAYYAAKKTGIPFVTTFHGIYSGESKFKQHYNSVMVKGARVIAVSKYVAEHILKNYAVDPTHVRTIARGVDLHVFDQRRIVPARLAELVQLWRLPDDDTPIIFCPGRITRIKGLDVLVDALARLGDLPFLCIIAGSDDGHEDYRAELQKRIMERGLGGKVRMVNATTHMCEAYQLADLVVAASIKPEAFGRVAIEAQAMGVAVVATDHGGLRETILPNETGYLVPPGDDASMAEAIRFALARDDAMVQAMGDFAIQHIQRNFSAEQMKKKTIDVYRELLP